MAASPELDISVGITLAFANANVPLLDVRLITDVTLPGAEMDVFESSHQGTTVAKTFIPGDLYDCGTFECTVQHKQDADYFAEVGLETTVTLELPHKPSATRSKLVFGGVIQSYKPQNTPLNEPMFADVVIKVSGDVVVTAEV